MSYNILLVDDDVNQAHIVERVIQDKMQYKTRLVETGQEAIDVLTSKDASGIDLVLLDLSMPGIDGVDVLNAVKPIRPNLPIIIRTGYDDIDMAVEAMKSGADDYIKKVDSPNHLKKCIDNALRRQIINNEMSLIKKSSEGKNSFGKNSFDNVLGSSQSIKDVIALASRVSESDIPVLLQGESGSGKELVAHTIHNSSKRCDKQFVAVNCGAIPENLVESILFGHEKGAFTGAFYKTFGKFREADGGTIFLDEINELSKDFQVKLLRLLQHGEIEPVGANKPMKVNVRVISATSCDLSKEVAEGRFREDLYYRISVFPIKIPSLRSRKQDIPFLINYFIKNFCQSESKKIDSISKEAEKFLCDYRWPGNIRQLKNAIFRAVVMCDSDRLTINDFLHLNPVANTESDDILNSPRASKMIVNTNIFFDQVGKDMRSLSDIEKDIITTALEYYNGHISKISKKLGIGRSTLYRKMLEYNIPHNKNL